VIVRRFSNLVAVSVAIRPLEVVRLLESRRHPYKCLYLLLISMNNTFRYFFSSFCGRILGPRIPSIALVLSLRAHGRLPWLPYPSPHTFIVAHPSSLCTSSSIPWDWFWEYPPTVAKLVRSRENLLIIAAYYVP